jgi:ABC-type multidrug transport system ATPase subunit
VLRAQQGLTVQFTTHQMDESAQADHQTLLDHGRNLAAGKPVVVQDTGWSEHLPSGEGVFAFNTPAEAAAALDKASKNYEHHCQAAREFAEKHFEAGKVCAELLE